MAIAAGSLHSIALLADRRVAAWGDNSYGQTNVPADLTNAIAISAKYNSSMAITADGRLRGWGQSTDCGLSLRYKACVADSCGNAAAIAFLDTCATNSDTDGDGMPDLWELTHGLNPCDPADAADDPDHDGLTNLQEYQHGTDPHNADTDGDGFDDGLEVARNASPTNPSTLTDDPDNDGLDNYQESCYVTIPGAVTEGMPVWRRR